MAKTEYAIEQCEKLREKAGLNVEFSSKNNRELGLFFGRFSMYFPRILSNSSHCESLLQLLTFEEHFIRNYSQLQKKYFRI